jgi:hypothetical protein
MYYPRGSPPEPVFAEGLYRAALDKLDGPYAIRDNRSGLGLEDLYSR